MKMEIKWAKVKATSRLKAMVNKNPTAVYLDYGAGFWYVEPLTESISQVSYTLYMDSGGALTNNLNDLLNIDDENLYKLNQGQETTIIINDNIVTKLFKNFKYKSE